jgi:dienelactone hydrolase
MKGCRLLWLFTALLAVFLGACAPGTPTLVPEPTVTRAFDTVVPTSTILAKPTDTVAPPPTATPTSTATPEPSPTPTPEPSPTPTPPPTPDPGSLPEAVPYNLGETTIVQSVFPEDSRFRHMPVRLEGVIAVPEGQERHPVVLILHGSHHACPSDQWPCAPEREQKNYLGFGYLVSELAARGYVALAINLNAEHTFGFGETISGERTRQLVSLHLDALGAAGEGGSDAFGVDLAGRVDLARLAWIGHSRGGGFANQMIRDLRLHTPEGALQAGFGPVAGLLQIAPSYTLVDYLPLAGLPVASIMPACDGDLVIPEGQFYYESARMDAERQHVTTAVLLPGANHNHFNTVLKPDSVIEEERPDCAAAEKLSAEEQRAFLVGYAADYLAVLFGQPADASAAVHRLGIDPGARPPGELYGHPARVSLVRPAAERRVLILPQSEDELVHNLQGGAVTLEGVEAVYCREGYYTPVTDPGTEPCRRVNLVLPGYPAQLVLAWEQRGSAFRTALPEGARDVSGYAALHLRAVLDPLSELNAKGQAQSFSLSLVDVDGNAAQVTVPGDAPALAFPAGVRRPNDYFEGDRFTGLVYMSSIRVPLAAFAGIDLGSVVEVALVFDQTDSGRLFVADLEFVAD